MKTSFLAVIFSALCVFSLESKSATDVLTVQSGVASSVPALGQWGLPLQTGQIVVTESPVPINIIYLFLYPEYSPFIHVGIIEVEGNDAFVYEASGVYTLGFGGKPPTDNVSGHVRRITLDDYLRETGGTATFYNAPAGLNIGKMLQYARSHAELKTPFDPYFNYSDRSKLYCSEFVAAAFEAGDTSTYRTVPMKLNRSMQVIMNWLKVTDKNILPVYQLVARSHWIGTISQNYTLTELKVDRAIKAELYQRFTADQKLGNVLAWGTMDVAFQPAVTAFRQAAFAAFDKNKAYPADYVLSEVKRLADIHLGQFNSAKVAICKIDFSLCH